MTRDEFRQQMELYRQAREQNPQLSYWQWKTQLGEIVDKANQSNANFIDRLNQFNRQTIPDWSDEGDIATHRMSWAEDENGNAIVYPEVQEINGKLHDLTDPKYKHGKWDVLDSAIQRGDTLQMTPFEAQQFTGGYKNFYPKFDEGTNKEGVQDSNNIKITKVSDVTEKEGIRTTSERPVTVNPYTGEFEYAYNPGAGYLRSVIDTRDLLDFTPVGNATTAYDAYNAYDAGDYLGAGLIGAAALLPGAIAKPAKKLIKRAIPEVNPNYVNDKLNQLIKRNKEVRPNGLPIQMYEDAINQRNHILEELQTNQDYWNRAADIQREFGDDYTSAYIDAMEGYWNGYLGLPEPKLGAEGVRASMNARPDAIDRFNKTGQPAGIYDFEYQINPNYEVTNPITRHELSHYIDFNVSKSPSADRNNSMFREMKKDLSKSENPMYPDNTSYYSQGTEQKSYMNTLRQYMYDTGQIETIGDKVTTKQIKEAIKTLPEQYNSVKAAFKQFKTPSSYTKWFNKMPLLTIPGAAMYIQNNSNKESN